MAGGDDDVLERWLGSGVIVGLVGIGISTALKIPLVWGIVLAILLGLSGGYLYACRERRRLQDARRHWDAHYPWVGPTQQPNSQEEEQRRIEAERQRKEAEEAAARTKGKVYYEPKFPRAGGKRSTRVWYRKTARCKKARTTESPSRATAPDTLGGVAGKAESAGERQQRIEEQRREERKRQFAEQRRREEREKVEAAIAERKRRELEAREQAERNERNQAREEQQKQEEESSKPTTETHGHRTDQKAPDTAARQDSVVVRPTSDRERRGGRKTREPDRTARLHARVTSAVVRMCRGTPALPAKEVRRMIADKFIAICDSQPTLPEIVTIEAAVVERLVANCFDGWVYVPVKRVPIENDEDEDEETKAEEARGWRDNAIRAMEGD